MKLDGKAAQILQLIKIHGPLTASALAIELDITSVGTRAHLLKLAEKGLVSPDSPREAQRGTGRPSQYWHLTEAASDQFPNYHSQLNIELVDAVRSVFGNEGLEQLINEQQQGVLRRYREQLAALADLGEKVSALATLRTEDGYMAEARFDENSRCWLLIENHCPISAAARCCQGFCRGEQAMFRELLEAEVEAEDYLLLGERRCSWRIFPRQHHSQLSLL